MTGATSGIGLESSVQLARLGHHLIMVGRDAAKTGTAVADVRRRASSDSVDVLLADFCSQASTRALAEEVLERYDRIDVLVNNAGTVFERRTETEDGVEATLAVNHLAPFLLTSLLRDRLVASAPARIVNVASVGHYGGSLDFDNLGYEHGGYSIMRAYARSKLAMVTWTRALARQLDGTGVTVNAVHPGTVATNIWSGAPWFARPVLAVAKRLTMVPAKEGAKRITYLAVSEEVAGLTGLYFEDDEPKEPSPQAKDEAATSCLLRVSQRLVGL